MASILPRSLFLSLLFHSILLVKCDEEDDLLRGINQYRTSRNLTALTKNDRAECLADDIADAFKNQSCTNTSGPNAPPGSEPLASNYLDILRKCRVNATSATQDSQILPVCVPGLQSGSILSNYTMSRYATYLNNTRFSSIGIGTEDDWIVVVLTASTSNGSGSFSPGSGGSGSSNPGNGASGLVPISPIVLLLIGLFVLF